MGEREILLRIIAPHDPDLARRIYSLLQAYERGRRRRSMFHDDLDRRHNPPQFASARWPIDVKTRRGFTY